MRGRGILFLVDFGDGIRNDVFLTGFVFKILAVDPSCKTKISFGITNR